MDNVENCTKTKSVLNILGPIASQVVELKGKYGTVCDATCVMKLLKQCEALKNSSDSLVSSIAYYARYNKDTSLSMEIQPLRGRLDDVLNSLSDFTRDLHRGDVGVRENEDVWSDIIENLDTLVSVLTEALLSWDKAEVRKIVSAVDHVRDQLERLQQVHFIQNLPEDFQEVVSACGELFYLVQHRCGDLNRKPQSEALQLLSLQLGHTLPLLASTCTATVSYPLSKHVKSSRELVMSRLQSLLKDLEKHSGQGNDEYDKEEAGTFISCVNGLMAWQSQWTEDLRVKFSHRDLFIRNKSRNNSTPEEFDLLAYIVDKTLDLLTGEDKPSWGSDTPTMPLSSQIKSLLEEVLRHGVAVAYGSALEDKHVIMNMCENVLKQLKNLVSLEQQKSYDEVDFDVAKEVLADSIECLEQKVNTSLIRQIVKTFAVPFVPLEALLKVLEQDQKEISTNALEDLIADFDLHVDNIFQVGGFAIACSSDLTRVRLIRNTLLTLEWLESCLVPSVLSAHNDRHLHAKAQAHMLAKHWSMAVEQLRSTLDEIMDPSAFSLVTKQEVHHSWALLKEQLYSQDIPWLTQQVENVIALSSRVLALHHLDSFLTGRQEDDLQLAISEVRKSLALVTASPKELSRHRSLIKRVQLILTLLSRLANSLNEENMQFLEELSCAAPKIPVSKPPPKLNEADKQQLITSNIDDIPVDVATPYIGKAVSRISREPSKDSDKKDHPLRSMKSASKLGEGRFKSTNSNLTAQGHHSRSMQAITSETLDLDGTSIDITKFLSRSTNTLTSSTRSSKRNFSLKVKEINLDIEGALKKELPPLPSQQNKKRHQPEGQAESDNSHQLTSDLEASNGKSLSEVSELIAKEKSLLVSNHSIGEEVTGILEDLTSLAGSLSALATPASQKRKYPWQSFDEGDKENQSSSSLHGIKIQNVSFNPKFPEIKDTDSSDVIFEDGNKASPSKNDSRIGECTPLPSKSDKNCVDSMIWKDFTAILETKTPAKSKLFNFSNNFDSWQPSGTRLSFTTFGKNDCSNVSPGESQPHDDAADLSDTPFLVKSASQVSLPGTGSTSVISATNYSVSPSSATFGTPQRLRDIHLVQERLKALKDNIK